MPSRPPTLYCDEDVSVVLAAMLRARGFPVTTTRDAGYLGRTDEQQLHVASDANQILVSHNRADFERLHRRWLEAGRRHAGIITAARSSGERFREHGIEYALAQPPMSEIYLKLPPAIMSAGVELLDAPRLLTQPGHHRRAVKAMRPTTRPHA